MVRATERARAQRARALTIIGVATWLVLPRALVCAQSDAEPVSDFHARATASPPPPSTPDLQLAPFRVVPRRTAESFLTLVPGLFLLNHAGAFHASTILLRGFDAGEGRDLAVLVHGVPINEPSNAHGHGYADTHFVIPELVDSLRVTEGPFAPEQSDFALAGSVEHRLGVRARGLRVQGELGSFDTRRLLLAWAPVAAERGTFAAVDLRDARGFGRHRASTSLALNAGYEHVVSPEVRLALLGFAHFADFDSAGVLRADDLAAHTLPCAPSERAQRLCAYDDTQGGASSRALLIATLSWTRPGTRLEQTIWGGWRRLRMRENFTGFLLDPRGDLVDQQYETGQAGLRGSYRATVRALDDRPQHLELGWIARHDAGTTRALRLRASDGAPYRADFDDTIAITHVGAHVAAELDFAEWIALRAALRADGFAYATTDHTEPERDREGERLPFRTTDALGISLQPRGTLRIRFAPWLEWQSSAGVGTRSSDAVALSDGERAPFARAIAIESGLALGLADHTAWALDARLVGFHTHVDRELVFDPERARNVDAGASSRLGALASVRVRVARWLDVLASGAWTEAFLLAPSAGWQEFTSDQRLPYVPRWTARLDVATHHAITVAGETITIGGGLGIGALGERPLPLGRVAPAFVLVDVGIVVRWRIVEVGAQITNLGDAGWDQNVFFYPSSFDAGATPSRLPALHAAAGAPRAALITLALLIDESDPLRGIAEEMP
ncbi:TonB-dependent receptor [Sandaracinus amylolyticus]|uniref:TonB-dependent receptor n=1 Tax=Sandaracinus amylolyticus TaxID=927083 RepID=UPI001F24651F|nr:TonB-dependent receptor [Sandaracinus amylolyticus]UJR80833.1 Nicel/Cobalt-specific TonB-dependent outer membrane receptor [Sandaracinus amylolyticus]